VTAHRPSRSAVKGIAHDISYSILTYAAIEKRTLSVPALATAVAFIEISTLQRAQFAYNCGSRPKLGAASLKRKDHDQIFP
jgi:hypothetical protein